MFGFFKPKSHAAPPSTAAAVALMKAGDCLGALREVDALIVDHPQVAMSHRFRGEVLFSLNRYDEAINSFQSAQTLGGIGVEETFFWIALSHANSGRRDVACSILHEYVESPGASIELTHKCMAAIEAFGARTT